MHVISTALEIPFIPYGVFPEALLPKRIFATMIA